MRLPVNAFSRSLLCTFLLKQKMQQITVIIPYFSESYFIKKTAEMDICYIISKMKDKNFI